MSPFRPRTLLTISIVVALVGVLVVTMLAQADTPSGALGAGAEASSPTPAAPSPAPSPSVYAVPEAFTSSIDRLTRQQQEWMEGENWASYCPIRFSDLRLLTVTYLNFDGAVLDGRVIVNRSVARDIVGVFEALYEAEFPIAYLDTIELYPPKQRPMKLRNVSAAYNCRPIAGSSVWSQHTYGLALDLNPVQNPYVGSRGVIPNAGRPYVNRANERQGMIMANGPVVEAFREIGWEWGGDWNSVKDYMHFSKTGG